MSKHNGRANAQTPEQKTVNDQNIQLQSALATAAQLGPVVFAAAINKVDVQGSATTGGQHMMTWQLPDDEASLLLVESALPALAAEVQRRLRALAEQRGRASVVADAEKVA